MDDPLDDEDAQLAQLEESELRRWYDLQADELKRDKESYEQWLTHLDALISRGFKELAGEK
jgi:hypothetical protein